MGLFEDISQQIQAQRRADKLNAEYSHRAYAPINNPIGEAVTQWGRGVAQRTMHPLETMAAEAQRWQKMPIEQMAQEVAGNIGGGVGGLAAHTVFHGSPHKFDKFDISKIGTGEGAQAYGHGLYFAESPDVAKSYQAALSRPDSFALSKADDVAAWAYSAGGGDKVDAARALTDEINRLDAYGKFGAKLNRQDYVDALDIVKSGKAKTGGALYKVDIPDEAIPKMLDWDKPLSEQSEAIQKFAREANISKAIGRTKGVMQAWREGRNVGVEATGKDLHHALTYYGEQGSREVADALRKAGIPGIRYLDAGSRAGEKGTSNYVLFGDELPKILERNSEVLTPSRAEITGVR